MQLLSKIFIGLGLFISIGVSAQVDTCNICPSGSTVTLMSTYTPTASHQWVCTNGFNSTLVNPTFNPTENTTCYLTVNDGTCIVQDTTFVKICNCNNSPCMGMSYNNGTNTLTFTPNGTINSTIATDSREYKRQGQTSYTNVPVSNTLTGCDVKATLNVTPYCNFFGGSFQLGYNATICPDVQMQGWNWRGDDGTNIFGVSSGTLDWVTLTPTDLNNQGNGGVLIIQGTLISNPSISIFARIRYVYSGTGNTCASITSTIVEQGEFIYDFESRRIVTYSDGCPPDTCITNINTDNTTCYTYGFLSRVNYGDPDCGTPGNRFGLFFSRYNQTAPLTFVWSFNGSVVPNNPASFTAGGYCLVGMPFGEYCVTMTDANGCTASDCYIYQATCTSTVSATESGGILTATAANCTGTASYQWKRWNGSSWINVGTGSTYNTGGITANYQVTLTCSGPPTCSSIAEIYYENPCNVSISIAVATTSLTATVTGCGANKTYMWQRWTGSAWVTVSTTTSTASTSTYVPTVSGLYKVIVTCNGCTAENQASITLPDPCANFSTTLNGNNQICLGSGFAYTRSISGGTSPFSTVWLVNFNVVSTSANYTFFPSAIGTYTLQVRVTDANNCQYTDTKTITVINCCALTTSISPTNATVCTNVTQTFTRSASGGVGTIATSWFSSLNGASNIFQGSGASISLSFATAGTYTIIANTTDSNGCTSQSTSTLIVQNCTTCNCTPFISIIGSCALQIALSGTGCFDYSYQLQYSPTGSGWTTIQSGGSFNPFTYTPTQNGEYRIVLSKAGCPGVQDQVSVSCVSTSCTNPPTISLNGNSITQCGLSPITISSNTFGGSATNVTLTEDGAGNLTSSTFTSSPFTFTYTPTASDIGNLVTIVATTNNPLGSPCTPAMSSFTIEILNNPTAVITSASTPLCVGQSRTLTASPTGGTFTVTGSGSLSGNTVTATGTGTINVTYNINVNGCTGSATQSFTTVALPTTPTATVNCAGGFGNAVITVSSPTGTGIEYKLNAGSYQTSNVFSGIANGVQTITVRNANGCESTGTVSVNCGCANSPTIVVPNIGDQCGIASHAINGTFTGATLVTVTLGANAGGTLSTTSISSSPFTVNYNPVASDLGKMILITFTSNNPLGAPCVADIKTYALTIKPLPTAVISGDNGFCTGGSVVLTASGGGTYNWSNSLGTNAVQTITSGGTYTVTVTSNGCTSTASKTVTQYPLPTVTLASIPNLCQGQTHNLISSPAGGTYSVSGGGTITGNQYTASSVGNITITYTYTDGNGCTNTVSNTFTVNGNPIIPTLSQDCTLGFGNGQIIVNSPTGLEYSLNGTTYQTSSTFTGLANGTYTVYVRNTSGCTSSNTINVSCGCVNQPTVALSPSSGFVCGTNTATINGTFGGSASSITITENGAGSTNITSSTSSSFSFTYTPTAADIGNIVTIVVTTNNPLGSPCVAASATYTLDVRSLPTAAITGLNSICAGQSTTFTASGGVTYSWSGGLGTNASVTVSTAGTYTVNVTGANTCVNTASMTLTVNPLPTPTITSSGANICVGFTRALTGSPTGGTFSIQSGNGSIVGGALTANGAGAITILYTYTDANGCTGITTQTINAIVAPSAPTLAFVCTGTGLATVTITPPATGGPYTYSLNGSAFTSTTSYSNLNNNTHTVVIRNSTGCESTSTITTSCGCNVNPNITLAASSASICSENTFTQSGNTFTGATLVTVSHNGSGIINASSFNTTPFTFTYISDSDDAGAVVEFIFTSNNPDGAPCQPSVNIFNLTVLAKPNVTITGDLDICIGESTTLTAIGASTYSWDNGLGVGDTKTVSPTVNTNYIVTGTSSNNCFSNANATVTVNSPTTLTNTTDLTPLCTNSPRLLTITPTGGTWSVVSAPTGSILFFGGGNTTSLISGSNAGTANLLYTYTNASGCVSTLPISIPIVLKPTSVVVTQLCGATTSTLTISPTGAGYTYSLQPQGSTPSFQSSNVFNNVPNGVYDVIVSNSDGCTRSTVYTVTNATALTNTTTLVPLCNNVTRLLTASPSGGVWTIVSAPSGTVVQNNGGFYVLVPGNVAGTANVLYTYTNSSGCVTTLPISINVSLVPTNISVTKVCGTSTSTLTVLPTGAGFTYSVQLQGSNPVYQSSNVFSNVANGTYDVTVRNADGCAGSIVETVSCDGCNCTSAMLVQNGNCGMQLTGSCSGFNVQFQRFDSPNWVNIANNSLTITAEYQKTYRVVLSKAGCPDVITNSLTNNFTIPAALNTTNFTNTGTHITNSAWSILGTRFFNGGTLPITTTTTPTLTSLAPQNPWHLTVGFGNSRMNLSAVKSIIGSNIVEFTIPSGLGSIVAIGFGADDVGKVCINGINVFNLTDPNTVNNFRYWYVVDYVVNAGDVIRIEYKDTNGVADGFGMEFYGQQVATLVNQTTVTPVYHSRLVTNASYRLCPEGTKPNDITTTCTSITTCRCN